ncbi:MAG: hypothetical protein Q8P86_03515 [bacterium]|nr:hypothetical protein [bacterium]
MTKKVSELKEMLSRPLAEWLSKPAMDRLLDAGIRNFADLYCFEAVHNSGLFFRHLGSRPGQGLAKINGIGKKTTDEILALIEEKKLPSLDSAHKVAVLLYCQEIKGRFYKGRFYSGR